MASKQSIRSFIRLCGSSDSVGLCRILDDFQTHDVAFGVRLNHNFVYDNLNHTYSVLMDERIRTSGYVTAELVSRIRV